MENKLRKNEVFQTAHLVILVSYTNLSIILAVSTLVLHWERWVLLPVAIGVLSSWGLHLSQPIPERARMWVYSILILVTVFFYGIHPEGVYNMVAIMAALMLVFTMTGEKRLITLSMLTYYLTLGCEVVGQLYAGAEYDLNSTLRVLLHIVLIFLVGWTARITIRKWNQVLFNADSDIEKLREETHRMDDFLTNLSHEIRTPVNAVIGLTTVILSREKDENLRNDIYTVQRAGHRVAEKIGDILDYTELDVGKLVITEEPYMIASVVNDLTTELRMRDAVGCELVLDVAPEIPSALIGDAVKIKKILNHLITNGLKFTPKGGVYVRVYTMERSYGVNLCIEITDTGLGMTAGELEHIFDSFYQHNSGRTRGTGGLGLGLTIVHGLVRTMGGFMTIDSEVGSGTTVSVSIPQKVADAERCMSVENREQLCVAIFTRLEKLEVPRVRDFYNRMFADLAHGLGIPLHRVESEDELRRLQRTYRLTHVFTGAAEYLEAAQYLESLTGELDVIVVADESFQLRRSAAAKVLRKPLCGFPVTTALGLTAFSEQSELDDNRRIYTPGLEALVVDDEPMNLLVAEGIFSDYGMHVTTARSGPEAIELCQKRHFDLIFMDHMMPEMDGVEAMKRLRAEANQRGEELLILALTANAVSSAREMFLAEGFDGFIPKPIETTDLERVLKRLLPKSAITYERPAQMQEQLSGTEADAPEDKETEADPLAMLASVGVRTQQGLRYCRGDMEFYRSLLLEYAHSAGAKRQNMGKFYDVGDWANYAILVHALKSTSKMIGAQELSELARKLELAAKEQDADTIAANHAVMLARYAAVSDAVLQSFGASEQDGGDDSEVLEFAPAGEAAENEILEFAPEGEASPEDEILEFAPEED